MPDFSIETRRQRQVGAVRAAQSIDPEARTARVVFARGLPVRQGSVVRTLSMEPGAADLAFFNSGRAPLLESHRHGDLNAVIGTVLSASVADGVGTAMIRFADTPRGDEVMRRVVAGEFANVSVGFVIHDEVRENDGGFGDDRRDLRLRTTKWEPVELSIVTVPADRGAHIRSQGGVTTMPETVQTHAGDAAVERQAPAIETREEVAQQIRSQVAAARRVSPTIPAHYADDLIAAGATPEEVSRLILNDMVNRQSPEISNAHSGGVGGQTYDNPDFLRGQMVDGLMVRFAPGYKVPEAARPFVGRSIPELARRFLEAAHISTIGLNAAGVVTRALHSTSDFPLLLGDVANKALRMAYEAAPSGIKLIARQTTQADFKPVRKLAAGEFPRLEKVNEHGEFKSGTIGEEGGEIYRLATYGRVLGITRQALVNDDLNALGDMARRTAWASNEFEARMLAELLTANPLWTDGEAVFSLAHGNIGATYTLDEANLTLARKAMRNQKAVDGESFIMITPKFLLVGPEQETAAEKIVAAIQPSASEDVNVFSGKLQVVVDPRIPDFGWYLAADPAQADGVEFAYLQEHAGPRVETRAGFEVDGVQIKVALDFGAGIVDYRGLWYSSLGTEG